MKRHGLARYRGGTLVTLKSGRVTKSTNVAELIRLSDDPDEDIRKMAVIGLSAHRDSAAIPSLLAILSDGDEDESIQREAIFGLELHNLSDELLELLRDERMGGVVRSEAAYAIGRLSSNEGINELFLFVDDRDRLVRQAASVALRKQGRRAEDIASMYSLTGTRRQRKIARALSREHSFVRLAEAPKRPRERRLLFRLWQGAVVLFVVSSFVWFIDAEFAKACAGLGAVLAWYSFYAGSMRSPWR
jgi:predicted ABC-type transport system involved in lysophospholipase L1 biosynthesis ATPase subunit